MNNDQLWQAVLGEIELNLSKANFTTWFKNTFISSFEDDRVVVCVPNTFTKAWLEKKYHEQIAKALKSVSDKKIDKIFYKVETRKNSPVGDLLKKIKIKKDSENDAPVSINRFGLNSKYLFNSFIVGKGNELAHAACQAVAANPGNAYNPLFIYGGVGLGKTHLLQAIGHEVSKNSAKILYVTCEKFTNDYIQSVKNGKAKDFKERYRNVDLLLIDDIQFMAGKEGTQEEFFHTFNELHQTNKQIVLTSDRPPKSIPALEKRLLSRFEWGMIADVVQPDIFYFGGMIRSMKVARMAEAMGMECTPHISGSGLGFLYMMQFVSVLPNAGPYHEFKGFSDEIPIESSASLAMQNGAIRLPPGPGLGITLDPAFVAKHRILQ